MHPKVSVLMPVYNGAAYLPEAIDSILKQTFDDFEFLIIDDGSGDGSQDIVNRYQDRRIRFVQNPVNLGQTRTLNNGLELARGDYIARQDQDDISLPDRLEKQISLMECRPAIGLVGSYTQIINSFGKQQVVIETPLDDLEIRWRIMTRNTFAHPSVVIRREVLIAHHLRYDESFLIAQDYDLWTAIMQYSQGANIDQPLIEYRIHQSSSSNKHLSLMLNEHHRIAEKAMHRLLPEFKLPSDKVEQLVDLLIARPKFFASVQNQRSSLSHLYLDMFAAFSQRHSGALAHQRLLQGVALDALYAVLFPPLPSGWMSVLWRAIYVGRGALIRVVPAVPTLLYRNWRFRQLRS